MLSLQKCIQSNTYSPNSSVNFPKAMLAGRCIPYISTYTVHISQLLEWHLLITAICTSLQTPHSWPSQRNTWRGNRREWQGCLQSGNCQYCHICLAGATEEGERGTQQILRKAPKQIHKEKHPTLSATPYSIEASFYVDNYSLKQWV